MSKSCCSNHQAKTAKKGGIDSFLIGIILTTVVLFGGVVYFGSQAGATTQIEADSQVQAVIGENRYDWGTIDINGGIVSKSFEIKNSGTSPLKLSDIKTSCMCTTAQLKTASITSKKFGMHEKSASIFEVKPGETAQLVVEFDPLFHGPSGVGPISRVISMNTNDPQQPTLNFNLSAQVVKK